MGERVSRRGPSGDNRSTEVVGVPHQAGGQLMRRRGASAGWRMTAHSYGRVKRKGGSSQFLTRFVPLLLVAVLLGNLANISLAPSVAHAAAQLGSASGGAPNRFNPHHDATSVLHRARVPGTKATTYVGPPKPIQRPTQMPMRPGVVTLQPDQPSTFLGSDGRLEVDVPAGAVSPADVAAAGGTLHLQVTQLAPGSGANAGGSGAVSLGTYLLQVVDSTGRLTSFGLRKPVTIRLHFGKRDSALNLRNTIAVLNGAIPFSVTTASAATTTSPLTSMNQTSAASAASGAPSVSSSGTPSRARAMPQLSAQTPKPPTSSTSSTSASATPTPVRASDLHLGGRRAQRPTLDTKQHTLTTTAALSTPSTSMTWNTDSPVAVFGKPDPFTVDLSGGGLNSNLSIDVPSGPGGLTPPVALSYSSASVSGQHNPQGAAGWVGEGWNLSLGAISWAEHNGTANCPPGGTGCPGTPEWEDSWQLSDPFGTSAELIPPDNNVATYYDDTVNSYCATVNNASSSTSYPCPIQWHTAPESYAKVWAYVGPITPPGMSTPAPCFRVWLANGIMEEFGCTADSLQYYYVPGMGDYLSSWNLDLITDPQGNQIHLTYQADTETSSGTSYQRDVELSTIEWDSPACHDAQNMCAGASWAPLMRVSFSASHTPSRLSNTPSGCNTGTNLRCDDPLDLSGSGGVAAPEVQSTFALNDVYVQVRTSGSANWNTLHDYQLGYQQNGPTTITDPVTGNQESTAGQFTLATFQAVGDDGQTTLPARTFGYTPITQYYEDDTYAPNPTTNCGPSWNTGNGSGCILWSQSYAGNSSYLSSASNGMGLQQAFGWDNARNNTHAGSNSWAANPLYCNSNPSGYPCNEADDQDWSHAVLTQQQDQVVRAASSGNATVTKTTAYAYQLTTPLAAQECGDCTAGMYWGNQDEGDYLDFYNGTFMGFAQASVSNADGSIETHKFYATEGWGVYDTSQIVTCSSNMQPVSGCHNDPWWALTNAAHGHEYEVDSYATDGTTLLGKSTTQYQAVCPPNGVSPTPADSFGTFDGNLVAALDLSNPVAVCDVQTTQTDDYTVNGSNASGVPDTTTTYTYDNYGRATASTTTSNDGGATGSPTSITHKSSYVWNDSVSASYGGASGTYLIDFPAATDTEDSSGNHTACAQVSYDGQPFASGQSSGLTLGERTAADTYTNCGTSANGYAPSGDLRTTTTYDTWGNVIAGNDADANAGNSAHLGCTAGGTTTYTSCGSYDTTFDALPTTSANALNQQTSTGYGSQTAASSGFGLWPVSTTDFNGQSTNFGYDALGRMTSETLPGETSGATTQSWTYTVWCSATGAQAPCVELDQTQRVNGTTAVTSRAFYDGYGNLVETRSPGPPGYDVVAYANYDPMEHLVFESNSYLVSAYTGGPGAAAFAAPDTTQAGTSTTYDGLDRVTAVTDPLSHQTSTTYSVECGAAGDTACYAQTAVVDALEHQQVTLSDALGRKIYDLRYTGNSASTYAVYARTTYTYDLNGDLVKILQPNGSTTTSYSYDAAGRKTSSTDPDLGTQSYTYDPNGNLTESVDARGASGTVYAGYDGLDRLLWRNTSNSANGAYVTYSYDSTANGNVGVGRKTGETFTAGSLSGTYAFTYDIRGQQTAQTQTVGSASYTTKKTYDDAGDVLTQTYPDGEVVTTQYTGQGWFGGLTTQAPASQGGATTTLVGSVVYSASDPGGAAGNFTRASLGGGTYTYAASYDLDHRLTSSSLALASTGATLFQSQPSYDAVGNVAAEATTLPQGTDSQQFCYDEQNRLAWAGSTGAPPCTGAAITPGSLTSAEYSASYSYDTMGRLTNSPSGAYTYGDSAHVHAATSIGSGWSAGYDAAGNMTCRAPTSATTCAGSSPTGQQLSWDAEGRLSAWQNAPGSNPTSNATYLYDGDGQRVAEQTTSSGSTTTTVYLGALEEVATSGSATTTTTYYYAGAQRIALAVNGVFSYLGNDLLGSADVALTSSGGAQAAQLYGPYGGVRYSNGTMPGSYGYTGQHADTLTGLDYYGARYYDPAAGQFISADSVLPGGGFNPWGLSRYAYVAGNPETHIDADGHCWPLCTILIGAAVGAVMGGGGDIVGDLVTGHSIDWGQVGKDAAVGALTGAISGLAGPEAGLATHAAIDAAASAGGQVLNNALNHKPLGDGVLAAAAIGGASSLGLGMVAEAGGAALAKLAGRAGEDVEAAATKEASHEASTFCPLSFAPSTLVTTPKGKQSIASLKVGDKVLAYDPKTGTATTQTVEQTYITQDTGLLDVTLRVIQAAKSSSSTSPAMDPAYKQRLTAVASHGSHAPPSSATKATTATSSSTTTLPGDETIHTTANHPWLSADRGWIVAGQLQLGESVQRVDGSVAVVVALTRVHGTAPMWDLTVSAVHDFAVGSGAYVVHNCGGGGDSTSTLRPGPHAGESIPARGPERDFTTQEREQLDAIGRETGCHSCGRRDPGTSSGHFIGDHQPPSALRRTDEPQRLFPHCDSCSHRQGGQVRTFLTRIRLGRLEFWPRRL